MSDSHTKPATRRDFLLKGGAVLGVGLTSAGVVATPRMLSAAASPADEPRPDALTRLKDREAIRELHRACTTMLVRGTYCALAELFTETASVTLPGLTVAGVGRGIRETLSGFVPGQAAEWIASISQSAGREREQVTVDEAGHRAAAVFPSQMEICTPLERGSTLGNMARQQGMSAMMRRESGRFEMEFENQHGRWRISRLEFRGRS